MIFVICVYTDDGDVKDAIRCLNIATLLDGERPSGRLALEPWIVQAALKRLGERQLSSAEQKVVYSATRTPAKVKWPPWWSIAMAR
jgi:hypothetical protein